MYLRIIILGLGLLIFYRIVSFLNKRIPISTETRHYFTVVLPIAELLSWLGLTVWCVRLLYESEMYAILIGLTGVLLLLLIPSWFLIRDMLYGILLVFQRKIELNTRIETNEISGKVVKIGYFTFEIRSGEGNIETVPYSKIRSGVISKSGENIHLEKQVLRFIIPAGNNLDDTLEHLKTTLLNSPWVAVAQQPIVKHVASENNTHIVDAYVYLLKKEYTEKIRSYVNAML